MTKQTRCFMGYLALAICWSCTSERSASTDPMTQSQMNEADNQPSAELNDSDSPGAMVPDSSCFDECIEKGADEVTCMKVCSAAAADGGQAENKVPNARDVDTGKEDGEPTVDCLEACAAKGADEQTCIRACAGLQGENESASGDETDTFPSTDGGAVESGAPDDEYEEAIRAKEAEARAKDCVACWSEDERAIESCQEQVAACEDSLACTQLQWCPALCDGDDCIRECNEIIPSGVPLLRAVLSCTVCNDGPCADECSDSRLVAYCDESQD